MPAVTVNNPVPIRLAVGALILMLAGMWSATSVAHDFWVEPADFRPLPETRVDVRLREGVGFRGNTLPYIKEWFRDFSSVSASGREDVDSLPGNDPAATLRVAAGGLLLGYESQRNFTTLEPELFNQYLEEEGIEFIRAERIAAGEDDEAAPEYFVRCAKALLHAGDVRADDRTWATVMGYRLELVPTENPYRKVPGNALTFELLLGNAPAEGLLLQAFTREDPERIQRIRTDAAGRATIELHSPGTWLVKAVSIQPIVGSPQAKWLSHWASFLFELPTAAE